MRVSISLIGRIQFNTRRTCANGPIQRVPVANLLATPCRRTLFVARSTFFVLPRVTQLLDKPAKSSRDEAWA
jgi:hypothetical protein